MGRIRVLLALAVAAFSLLTVGGASADHGQAAISGTVTDEASRPLEGICVIAYGWDWEWDDYYYVDETQTAEDGSYIIELYAGEFVVEFTDCTGSGYVGEWYDGAHNAWSAAHVFVEGNDHVESIDAALELGGSISGIVSDETTGDPIGVCVWAEQDAEPWYYSSTSTDEDGTYALTGLPSGNYRVNFGSCGLIVIDEESEPRSASPVLASHSSGRYISEYYDDKRYWEDADLVPVVAGVDTPGIDAQLLLGGTISGVVTGEDGSLLDGACVDVWDVDTQDWVGWTEGWNGDYTVYGLAPGNYKVQFYDCWHGEYASEWFDDKGSFGTADVVTVGLGEDVTGIDAVLAIAPMADLAVSRLEIERIPVGIAGRDLPVSTGWEQDVTVEIGNVGNERSDGGYAVVWAEGRSNVGGRSSYPIGGVDLGRLRPGESITETFSWNAFGSVGDLIVRVEVCSEDRERTYNNNVASARTYALVGGTGTGVSLPFYPGGGYGCWYYYEG